MPNNKKNNAAACTWMTNHPMRLAVFVLIALLAWRYFASTMKPANGVVAAEMYHPSPAHGGKGGGVLVMYFADWCPHCTRSKPAMESLQRKYGPERVRMEDCTDREVAKRFGVSSFPTYRYFPSGQNSDEHVAYNGPRDLASLETYLKTH